MDIFQGISSLGALGVAIAQAITSLIPPSWYASGILGLIKQFLVAVTRLGK